MTVTTADGSTVTFDIADSTYHAQTDATAADVTTGSTVSVSVEGLGGFCRPGGGAPGASGAPDASFAPGAGAGSTTLTATDVTITSK